MSQKNVPYYIQVSNFIRSQIINREYEYLEKIPSENSLALKHNVSRVTVRQALAILEKEGFIEKRIGSGSYVIYRSGVNRSERSPRIKSFTEEMSDQNIEVESKVVFFRVEEAHANIADLLRIKENDLIYHFQRVRIGNGKPYLIETSFMVVEDYPDLNLEVVKGSKYDYIENRKGLDIAYSLQLVNAIITDSDIARKLEVKVGIALPFITHTTFLDNGKICDYTELIINPEIYDVTYIKWRNKLHHFM